MGLAVKTAPSFYGKMKKKQVYRIISAVSLLVMILAILSIAYMLFLFQKSNREYQALAEAARAAAEQTALPGTVAVLGQYQLHAGGKLMHDICPPFIPGKKLPRRGCRSSGGVFRWFY